MLLPARLPYTCEPANSQTSEKNMDLEGKISALKDFTSFGSRSKNGSPSSGSIQSGQTPNSSSANGWGNWFAKGEKDPILPSLVGCLSIVSLC